MMQTDCSGMIQETIRYLNEKSGSAFRAGSASAQRPIMARANEGYTEEDFRSVIDEKCRQWLGNETMERYLRPQTLFGNKFEAYLQEARRHAPKSRLSSAGFRDAKELLS